MLEAVECVACRAVLEEARGGLSPADWQALLAGEIVTSESADATTSTGATRRVSAAGLVATAPAEIWSVLTDWPSYPRFMPNTVETAVRKREPRRAWLSQHLRVFWADVRYGVVWELDPEAGRVRFALDPGVPSDIAATEGVWQLAPLPGEGGTLLRYEAHVDTGMAVPDFVQSALTRRSLPNLVRAVREEAERRVSAPR